MKILAGSKRLKGIPGNLALSYLSTTCTYRGGYMADWIYYLAKLNQTPTIEIDILNKTIIPEYTTHDSLLCYMDKLQGILNTELTKNGFDLSFIHKAVMKFEIPIDNPADWTISCYPYLMDIHGQTYIPRRKIVDTAFMRDLDPHTQDSPSHRPPSPKLRSGFIRKLIQSIRGK